MKDLDHFNWLQELRDYHQFNEKELAAIDTGIEAIKLKLLVYDFLTILNREEVSDSDKAFRPNFITSCRVMDTQKMGKLLKQMEELSGYSKPK